MRSYSFNPCQYDTKKDEITNEAKEVSTGKVITSAGSIVASQINAKSFIECV